MRSGKLQSLSTVLALGSSSLQGPWQLSVQTLTDGSPRRPHGTETLTPEISRKEEEGYFLEMAELWVS